MRDVCESSQEPSSGRHWSTSQLKAFSRAKLASDKDTFKRTQTGRLEIKNLTLKNLSRVKMLLICLFHLLRFYLTIFLKILKIFEKFILKLFYKFKNLKTLKTILNFFFLHF